MYTLLPCVEGQERGSSGHGVSQPPFNVRAAWVAGAAVHGAALLTLARPSQVTVKRDLKYGGRSSGARLCIRWRSFTVADFWHCALDLVSGMGFAKARHAPYTAQLPQKYLSPTAWFGPAPKALLHQYHERHAAWWGGLAPLGVSEQEHPSAAAGDATAQGSRQLHSHPLLRALQHAAALPEPLYTSRLVDAEQPYLIIVSVHAHAFGGSEVQAESGVCDHEEIGQQQASLAALHLLQREDLQLLLSALDAGQVAAARAACSAQLNGALKAAGVASSQPSAVHAPRSSAQSGGEAAREPGSGAAAAGACGVSSPSAHPQIQLLPSSRQEDSPEEKQGRVGGMIVKVTYTLQLEAGCFAPGYPDMDHLLHQSHMKFTLGCGMVHPEMEKAVCALRQGASAKVRPFFVTQSGHCLSMEAGVQGIPSLLHLFPRLPATLTVTLDALPHAPKPPQLPRRRLRPLFGQGSASSGAAGTGEEMGALTLSRVEAVLRVLRHEVPGVPSGAACTLVVLGCGQGQLIRSLLSAYSLAMETVGPPLKLIAGIDKSTQSMAAAVTQVEPFLEAEQIQQQQQQQERDAHEQGYATGVAGTPAPFPSPPRQPPAHEGPSSLNERAHALEARDSVEVSFHRPHAFERAPSQEAQESAVGASPSVALLQADALSPAMAVPEAWGGLAGCDAAVMLEVLQRLGVEEIGAFGHCILGALRPRCVIISTPNWEYNTCMRAAMAMSARPGAAPQPAPTAAEAHLPDSTRSETEAAPANAIVPEGASVLDTPPEWPGPPGRDGRPLRHPEHRFEWTRQEFRSWASDQANQHGYSVRFEDVGHVMNEDQALEVLATDPQAQPPVVGLGGTATAAESAEQSEAPESCGLGGATQLAVFTLKDVGAGMQKTTEELVADLSKSNCLGELQKVLLRRAQGTSGPAPGPQLLGSAIADRGVMDASQAFDAASAAGSEQGMEQF